MNATETKEFDALADPSYEDIEWSLAESYPQATFSEAQWQEIKESLAERGVDLNAEIVDERYGPREWWGYEDRTQSQRPLRNVLQEVAYHAAIACELKPKTPKQIAKEVQEEVAEFEKVLDLNARNLPTFDELDARIERRKTLQAAIAEEIAERRAYLDKLEAAGSRSAENARTVYNDYWQILARLWLKATGSAGPLRRKRLGRFLLACTPSRLFDMDTQKLEQSVTAFVSNFFR